MEDEYYQSPESQITENDHAYYQEPEDDYYDVNDYNDEYNDYDDQQYEDLPENAYYADQEETYDVNDYDEILATYADARKQLNDLRLARGFYPTVAVVDGGGGDRGKGKSPWKRFFSERRRRQRAISRQRRQVQREGQSPERQRQGQR